MMELNENKIRLLQYLRKCPHGANSGELASACGISMNTVRKELNEALDIIRSNGMDLDAKPSKGYQLIIKDPVKANTFFQEMIQQENNPLFENNSSRSYKVNFIIRKLLTSPERIPLLRLADMLYYSESSLRRDLRIVEEKLKDFDLKLVLVKGSGYAIEGEEFSKRLCLVSQHKLYVNLDEELKAREPDFARTFCMEDPAIKKARRCVREALRGHRRLSYRLIEFPVIYNYLPLVRTRHAHAVSLHLNEAQEKAIEESGVFAEAEEILGSVQDLLPCDEKEVQMFAIVLLSFRSVTDLEQLNPAETAMLSEEADKLLSYVSRRLDIRPYLSKESRKALEASLYEIRNKLIFHIAPDNEMTRPYRSLDPFAQDLCLATCRYLENVFRAPVPLMAALPLYDVYLSAVEEMASKNGKIKAALLSTYGWQYTMRCRELIWKNYAADLETLDAYEYSEVTAEKLNGYDLLIADVRPDMLPKKCTVPMVHMEFLDREHPRVFLLDHFLEDLRQNRMFALFHHEQLESTDLKHMLDEIAAKLAPGNADFRLMLEDRLSFSNKQSHEYTLLLSASAPGTTPAITFYHLPAEITWNKKPITQIAVCSYRPGADNPLREMERALATRI